MKANLFWLKQSNSKSGCPWILVINEWGILGVWPRSKFFTPLLLSFFIPNCLFKSNCTCLLQQIQLNYNIPMSDNYFIFLFYRDLQNMSIGSLSLVLFKVYIWYNNVLSYDDKIDLENSLSTEKEIRKLSNNDYIFLYQLYIILELW